MTYQSPILSGDGDDDFRSQVVGASEVAALFGVSPWLTEFELHHRKAGNIATPDFAHDERTEWGVRLEPVIIQAACERYGYMRQETPKRADNGAGLGGHPDAVALDSSRGLVVLETKTADWLVAKGWGDEPPLQYQLQLQTYIGLLGHGHGDLIVLVGGNELRRFSMEFRPKLYAEIERRVASFWKGVREGKAPRPDYARDCAALVEVIGAPDDSVADLRHDNRAPLLAAEYLDAKERERCAKAQADALKAELIDKIGAASTALLDGYRVGCGQTKDSRGTLITDEMVGTHIGGRKGYRRFDIRELEAK